MKPLPPQIDETLVDERVATALRAAGRRARNDSDDLVGPTRLAVDWDGRTFAEWDVKSGYTLAVGEV